jgi:hypothetical protein
LGRNRKKTNSDHNEVKKRIPYSSVERIKFKEKNTPIDCFVVDTGVEVTVRFAVGVVVDDDCFENDGDIAVVMRFVVTLVDVG